jgi:hypothetical protein
VLTGLQNLIAVTTAANTVGLTGNINRATITQWRNTIGTAIVARITRIVVATITSIRE